MRINRTIGTGGLLMMLVVALAALGIGIALWSKVLTIRGVVQTGTVNAAFVEVFTDDDNVVNDPAKDEADVGVCPLPLVDDDHDGKLDEDPINFDAAGNAIDDDGDGVANEDPPGKLTSCDPAETGRDPKLHYDKDVAQCRAIALADGQDNEPQPGSQAAFVRLENAYPSYHCTAWFEVENTGSIPVLLHSVSILEAAAAPCESGVPTPYDLNGDGFPDIEICLSDVPRGEPQIDPGDVLQFNLDIHVLQTAPQDSLLSFNAALCLHQWNEEGSCGQPNFDRIIDADGIASALSGDPAAREILLGQALTSWPTSQNEGIDSFDNDNSDSWTAGDDIHLEDPTGSCPTASRNAFHDVNETFQDCDVLDIDGSFVDGQAVTCDLEGMIPFDPGSCDTRVKFHDANGNGVYDNGEDIVLDVNNNGIFD